MPETLIDAVIAADVGRVRELLAAGADCNARDGDGATALMLAAHAGRLDLVQTLIDAGADVNATDERGWGALAKAVYNADLDRGFADVVQLLIGGCGGDPELAVRGDLVDPEVGGGVANGDAFVEDDPGADRGVALLAGQSEHPLGATADGLPADVPFAGSSRVIDDRDAVGVGIRLGLGVLREVRLHPHPTG